MKRYLKLRNRLNRLVAKRDGHRRPKVIHLTAQAHWPEHRLWHRIRQMRKHIRRARAHLRAGLTHGVRALLERIAFCESRGNPHAIGGGGAFRGKYQFTYGTWSAVGGRGDPAGAPEGEQDLRAAILLKRTGGSAWPVCG